jgi:hypothetical protein
MKELAQLLIEMQAAGVIESDALFGAAAQIRYTEPVATLDPRRSMADAVQWDRFVARYLDA